MACGVSPFLYVLGMWEFRQKVKKLVKIPKLKKNSVNPTDGKNNTTNQVDQTMDNIESYLAGPSRTQEVMVEMESEF